MASNDIFFKESMKFNRLPTWSIVLMASFLLATTSNAQPTPGQSSAASPVDPLDSYHTIAKWTISSCLSTFNITQLRAQAGAPQKDDYNVDTCIAKGKQQVKDEFTSAMKEVTKPAAQQSLKMFHVAFLSALEGVQPGPNETRSGYNQRQQSSTDKMTQAWALFEVER